MHNVLDYAKSFESVWPQKRTMLNLLSRLDPVFKFVNDFVVVVGIHFGADTKLTAFVWGSIRLILTLASCTGDVLRDVLDMLEEVGLKLPKLRGYEQDQFMNEGPETFLLNLFTEIICFYARMIQFLRSHPNILLRRNSWNNLEADFLQTVKRIQRISSEVDSEADIARMRLETEKYREVLGLLQNLKDSNIDHDQNIVQCYYVPQNPYSSFSGREEALFEVKNALSPSERLGLKIFALYGMGGVGKTQIALQFAEQTRDLFDSVLWLNAATTISMRQSVRDVSQTLGLAKTDGDVKDTFGQITNLKNWLRDTRGRWLLVLDNADDIELLKPTWPAGDHGSILVTSRDFKVVSHPASTGYYVKPFDRTTGSSALLQLLSLDAADATNRADAIAVVEKLGGLVQEDVNIMPMIPIPHLTWK